MFALVTPFVYYAKTANLDVPYLFWFALSLVFYLRAARWPEHCATVVGVRGVRDAGDLHEGSGVRPVPADAVRHRPADVAGQSRRRRAASAGARADRPAAGDGGRGVARALRCRAQPGLQPRGFEEHVRYITGPAAARPTATSSRPLAGRLALLRLTVDLVRVAWGWPMFLVSVGRRRRSRCSTPRVSPRRARGWRCRWCRTTPASSTSCSTTTTASCCRSAWCCRCSAAWRSIAGCAAARRPGVARRRRRCGVFACTLLYAATGRRRDAARLALHGRAVAGGARRPGRRSSASSFLRSTTRGSTGSTARKSRRSSSCARTGRRIYVLNADYARAEPPGHRHRTADRRIAERFVSVTVSCFGTAQPAPWPWLPGSAQGPGGGP